GPSGVGKTAVVHELVRRKSEHSLSARTFFRSSGSRIVAGMCGFGMWQDRCRQIVRDAPPRKAVLHLGSLLELMQVGQSSASSESIASFLRPFLVRGQLVVVAECTHEQLAVIEKREPKLLDAFRQITLTEPQPESARDIIRAVAENKFTGAALGKTDDLHRRYTSDTAYPGRPLRFLSRISSNTSSRKLDTAAVLGAFAKETGMPQVLLSDDHPLDLTATREWFCSRIAGQDAAVSLIVDTLATIKTNLNRPGKPLASFLFIGPTGVGKTELAKVLAEFLYNSRDRMIRLDMSEYNTPFSASRLVSDTGIGGREGLLTAKVREHPFSVILLDEFEKADPTVFDLFLQVLGEARLTDGAGRIADFSNSVIIMTSNLGAREYQRGSLGFAGDPARDAVEHFSTAVKAALRPELFNRIDRILPFLPLPREIIAHIIRREFSEIDARDGLGGHGTSLLVAPEVLDHLVTSGYDPRYGARPLKRAVERLLLQPAAELLAVSTRSGADLAASLSADNKIVVSWQSRQT
ncbi:MAG: AAA family ATPase, partial [Verrucomicrobiales bacterium]|nr:AAA family ATPase [Verrucomicrobiales bacterium]